MNSVAWSLEIEVQFYLLAPLLFRIFPCSRIVRRTLFILIGVASMAAQTLYPESHRLNLSLIGQAQYFIVGILLADLYVDSWRGKNRTLTWDILSYFGWVAVAMEIKFSSAPYLLCFCILLAYCGAFRGRLVGSVLKSPLLATIGGMCYSIYLYHYWFISAFGRFTFFFSNNLLIQTALVGIPTLIGCTLLFLLAEKPFMSTLLEESRDRRNTRCRPVYRGFGRGVIPGGGRPHLKSLVAYAGNPKGCTPRYLPVFRRVNLGDVTIRHQWTSDAFRLPPFSTRAIGGTGGIVNHHHGYVCQTNPPGRCDF